VALTRPGENEYDWDDAHRPRMRLDEVLTSATRLWADNEAIVDSAGRLTYRELDAMVERCAESMCEGGVGPGDRVATLVSAGAVGVALLYAISRIGAVSVAINELHSAPEVADALRRSRARYFIADDRLGAALGDAAYELLAPSERPARAVIGSEGDVRWLTTSAVDRAAPLGDDIAIVLFTSGSTAQSKGVLVTHESLVGVSHYATLALGMTSGDRFLDVMPTYHVAGITNAILPVAMSGGTLVIARFAPEPVLELFENERITTVAAFGPMYEAILNAPGYSPSRHPAWHTASLAQGTPQLISTLRSLGVTRLASGYGLTETGADFTYTRPWQPDIEISESVGMPIPGIDVRIVDPVDGRELPIGETGEVRVKGWNLCRGYIDGSHALDDAGYLKTGDLACVRPAGTLEFKGRLKFMIKSGGENVSAYEVEHFLITTVPEVEQAVLVGVPDERWGEKVVAFVSFAGGATLSADELKARCTGHIAGYKIPKEFIFIDGEQWPLMAAGKVDRPRLTALAIEQLAVAGAVEK
jgi:acyl-CoA synthetase (AMP-forming)/AMP-acid ligase II